MSYVVITGASSGIGKEFAKRFAQSGFDLLLVASNEEKLLNVKEELANDYKSNCLVLSLDLTEVDSAKKVFDYVVSNNLNVSCLVNNAGYGDFGLFLDGDLAKFQKMIDLNDRCLVSMAYYFGNYFKEKEFGHLVNIASIAGFMPGPYMSVYYASKAFVLNFSLALKEELKPYNVKVTTICPGPIDTNFWNRANVTMSNIKKKYFTRTTKQLVDSSMYKIENGGGLHVDGVLYKSAAVASRFISKETLTTIMKYANCKLGSRS